MPEQAQQNLFQRAVSFLVPPFHVVFHTMGKNKKKSKQQSAKKPVAAAGSATEFLLESPLHMFQKQSAPIDQDEFLRLFQDKKRSEDIQWLDDPLQQKYPGEKGYRESTFTRPLDVYPPFQRYFNVPDVWAFIMKRYPGRFDLFMDIILRVQARIMHPNEAFWLLLKAVEVDPRILVGLLSFFPKTYAVELLGCASFDPHPCVILSYMLCYKTPETYYYYYKPHINAKNVPVGFVFEHPAPEALEYLADTYANHLPVFSAWTAFSRDCRIVQLGIRLNMEEIKFAEDGVHFTPDPPWWPADLASVTKKELHERSNDLSLHCTKEFRRLKQLRTDLEASEILATTMSTYLNAFQELMKKKVEPANESSYTVAVFDSRKTIYSVTALDELVEGATSTHDGLSTALPGSVQEKVSNEPVPSAATKVVREAVTAAINKVRSEEGPDFFKSTSKFDVSISTSDAPPPGYRVVEPGTENWGVGYEPENDTSDPMINIKVSFQDVPSLASDDPEERARHLSWANKFKDGFKTMFHLGRDDPDEDEDEFTVASSSSPAPAPAVREGRPATADSQKTKPAVFSGSKGKHMPKDASTSSQAPEHTCSFHPASAPTANVPKAEKPSTAAPNTAKEDATPPRISHDFDWSSLHKNMSTQNLSRPDFSTPTPKAWSNAKLEASKRTEENTVSLPGGVFNGFDLGSSSKNNSESSKPTARAFDPKLEFSAVSEENTVSLPDGVYKSFDWSKNSSASGPQESESSLTANMARKSAMRAAAAASMARQWRMLGYSGAASASQGGSQEFDVGSLSKNIAAMGFGGASKGMAASSEPQQSTMGASLDADTKKSDPTKPAAPKPAPVTAAKPQIAPAVPNLFGAAQPNPAPRDAPKPSGVPFTAADFAALRDAAPDSATLMAQFWDKMEENDRLHAQKMSEIVGSDLTDSLTMDSSEIPFRAEWDDLLEEKMKKEREAAALETAEVAPVIPPPASSSVKSGTLSKGLWQPPASALYAGQPLPKSSIWGAPLSTAAFSFPSTMDTVSMDHKPFNFAATLDNYKKATVTDTVDASHGFSQHAGQQVPRPSTAGKPSALETFVYRPTSKGVPGNFEAVKPGSSSNYKQAAVSTAAHEYSDSGSDSDSSDAEADARRIDSGRQTKPDIPTSHIKAPPIAPPRAPPTPAPAPASTTRRDFIEFFNSNNDLAVRSIRNWVVAPTASVRLKLPGISHTHSIYQLKPEETSMKLWNVFRQRIEQWKTVNPFFPGPADYLQSELAEAVRLGNAKTGELAVTAAEWAQVHTYLGKFVYLPKYFDETHGPSEWYWKFVRDGEEGLKPETQVVGDTGAGKDSLVPTMPIETELRHGALCVKKMNRTTFDTFLADKGQAMWEKLLRERGVDIKNKTFGPKVQEGKLADGTPAGQQADEEEEEMMEELEGVDLRDTRREQAPGEKKKRRKRKKKN